MEPWHTLHLTSFLWTQQAAASTHLQLEVRAKGVYSVKQTCSVHFTLCSSVDDTVTRRPCNLVHCTVMKDESRRVARRAERRTGRGREVLGCSER